MEDLVLLDDKAEVEVELLEERDLPDLLECPDHLASLVCLEEALKEELPFPDALVLLDWLDHPDNLEALDSLDPLDSPDPLDVRDPPDSLDSPEMMETLDNPDSPVSLETLESEESAPSTAPSTEESSSRMARSGNKEKPSERRSPEICNQTFLQPTQRFQTFHVFLFLLSIKGSFEEISLRFSEYNK